MSDADVNSWCHGVQWHYADSQCQLSALNVDTEGWCRVLILLDPIHPIQSHLALEADSDDMAA